MRTNNNLVYALKDNKLVYVEEVESGLACGCICPACKEKLIAKKGNKLSHHFSHYSAEDCGRGYETSLHLLAKEILSEEDEILIPDVYFSISYNKICLAEKRKIKIDSVKAEIITNNIIPDIIVSSENRQLIIEIYVTHKTDEEKFSKIKDLNISAIEIDLSKIDRAVTKQELRDILLNDSELKTWIYNSYIEKYRKCFYKFADEKLTVHRGFACHVDYCPAKRRIYNKKPYANFIDDCTCCEYHIDSNIDKNDELISIFCSGRNGYSTNMSKKELDEIFNKLLKKTK